MVKENKFFILGFLFLFVFSSVSAIQIPYNDLTLNWKGEYKFINEKLPDYNLKEDLDWTYQYTNLDGDKILQRNLEENTEELINVNTRNLISDDEMFTTHWISLNVKIGDRLILANETYTVMSLSDKIYLKDLGNLEAIKLIYEEQLEDIEDEYGKTTGRKYKNTYWFEKTSGLKIKVLSDSSDNYISYYLEETYPKKSIIQYELRENNVDNDEDGLTDLQELFKYQTNPSLKDSDEDGLNDKKEIEMGLNPINENTDGDLWIDGKDSNPLSKVAPLIYYIIGLILICGLSGGFFWFKSYNKKKK